MATRVEMERVTERISKFHLFRRFWAIEDFNYQEG